MSRPVWLIVWLIAWAGTGKDALAQAVPEQRNPGQQLAAELVIMAGDVRRLLHEKTGPLETRGLQQRLSGGAASLPLTLRRAGGDASVVGALRAAIDKRDWPTLARQFDTLKQRYPFDARPFLTAESPASGGQIHRQVCAACHDHPAAVDTLLPAKNLASQLKSMPREEFAARLWLGVRGDKTTAYANPFSNRELVALLAWYSRQP